MLNRDTFYKDPKTNPIINDGVADFVHDDRTLRFELQTFVCEGEYETAISKVLSSYLGNLNSSTQPAVWLSGFFGSGKSHVAKMLAALWADHEFSDKARARTVAQLPAAVHDLFVELSTQSKKYAPLHVSAGKLLGHDADPPTAVLNIILHSLGLPDTFHTASVCRWLKEEGIYEKVVEALKEKGKSIDATWPNMYVAPEFGAAISQHTPGLGKTSADVLAALRAQFPRKQKLTIDDFRPLVQWALRHDKSYRLTAIVLDEVEQYLLNDAERIGAMQWVVECLSKEFDGRLIVLGTGQTAMTMELFGGKLNDRFTVKSILKETDVQRVVRRVVLQKDEKATATITDELGKCSGEISRHLNNTRIGPKGWDANAFVPDYPLLPTRQRFWSAVLRAYDPTETKGRVRGMLRVVYRAVLDVLDEPVGQVISGDAIYDTISAELLQYHQISERLAGTIGEYRSSNEATDRIKGSLLALVHLIHLLPRGAEADTGVRATKDNLADLIVTDLPTGSAQLRKQVDDALQHLVDSAELMESNDEYHLQTSEDREWELLFQKQRAALQKAEPINTERRKRVETMIEQDLKKLKIRQGTADLNRPVITGFGPNPFGDPDKQLLVFVRNEWDETPSAILDDIRSRGDTSPHVTIVLPREPGDALKDAIVRYLAASKTIELKGHGASEEVAKTRANFEARVKAADKVITEVLSEDILAKAKVYLDGGDLVDSMTLSQSVQDACEQAAKRMFHRFKDADFSTNAWKQVLDRARKFDDKPLKPLNYEGDLASHALCIAVLKFVADNPNKKGSAVIDFFGRRPYGWEDDAVIAILAVLVKDKHLRATGPGGIPLDAGLLDVSSTASASFAAETVTLSAGERLGVRGLFSSLAGITCKTEELESKGRLFIETITDLAALAGGDAPLPARPAPPKLKELQQLTGPELLRAVLKDKDQLTTLVNEWKSHRKHAEARLPRWQILQRLLKHAAGTEIGASVQTQAHAIRDNRSLLTDPDPIPKLITALVDVLRPRLSSVHAACRQAAVEGMEKLSATEAWAKLKDEQRQHLIAKHRLEPVGEIAIGSDDELLAVLDQRSFDDWKNLQDAIPGRFSAAMDETMKILQPKAKRLALPPATLNNEDEVRAWVEKTQQALLAGIKEGPIMIG